MNFYKLDFGVFSLKIYGIFIALAFFVGVWNFYKTLQKKSLLVDFFIHHFWRWVLAGLVVGRIVALLLNPESISSHGIFSFFAFWQEGISTLGAFVGFIFVAKWDLKKHGFTFSQWIDLGVRPILLGVCIVDVAAFLTGAVYGTETSLPWGVQYETFGVDTLNPVHPVSIYAFFVHVWLLYYIKRRLPKFERFPEKLAIHAGILFFTADFFLRFLHGDMATLIFGYLRWEQILDLVILAMLTVRGVLRKVL